MLPRISEIIQLGYPLINAVGHFIDRLYTKHTRVDVRFVARRPHVLRHSNHFYRLPLRTARLQLPKRFNYNSYTYIIVIQRD